jgi:LysM repeat protein
MRYSLRMLAPISLGLFAVIFLIVIVASLGGDSNPKQETPTKQTTTVKHRSESKGTTGTTGPTGLTGSTGPTLTAGQRFYVVKAGDTLSKIAAATGVEIEQLLALNPSIDPQGLVTGQRIKLQE